MLTVSNLEKRYGKIIALNGVHFQFKESQVTAIMGENGAGKSTLLKICAGILSFDKGEVLIDDFSIAAAPLQARERIGYLPEMPYMYDRLTGREFLYYIASLRKLSNVEQKVVKLSELLEVTRFLDYEIGTYSKGMKQKISIISAILHAPGNLLLDEPVWGLDPLTSRTLQRFITEQKGTTVIATHSPGLVENVADTVYFLTKGTVVSSGKVAQIMQKFGSIEDAYFHVKD